MAERNRAGEQGGAGRRVATWLRGYFAVDDDWERPVPDNAIRRDAWMAAVVFALSVLGIEAVRSFGVFKSVEYPVVWQYVGVVTGCAAVVFRRTHPILVGLYGSLHMVALGLVMPVIVGQASMQVLYFVLLFSAVAWARERRHVLPLMLAVTLMMTGWLAWGFALGGAAEDLLRAGGQDYPEGGPWSPVTGVIVFSALINLVYFGGAAIMGQSNWRKARQQHEMAEQAQRIAEQADQLRDQALIQERLRIARELHDVVAHHVSVMGVQAGGARAVLTKDPQAAAAALQSVEASARSAVTEMRSLLGTLRGAGHSGDDRQAQPGLDKAAELVAGFVDDHRQVTLTVVRPGGGQDLPAPEDLPRGVHQSLYRVTQEALSNVRAHSTARNVSVTLRLDPAFAEVEVLDDGRERPGTSGTGLGLLGIRERVRSLGGTSEIGPRVTGGYRVRVRLPIDSKTFVVRPVSAGSS